MNKTGYLIFEIGRECNLGHLHTKCPNQHPDRYNHVDTSQAMSDDMIIDTAVSMIQEHGFRGLIGFHYYNEPTLQQGRMLPIMRRIKAREESAKFVLWTNGIVSLPRACVGDFSEIHVTDYSPAAPPCELMWLRHANKNTHIHRWPFDDRLTATGDEPGRPVSNAPCCRMFTEMIFDYYGNVHLCCYDWRGLGSSSNVHTRPLGLIVDLWQKAREAICVQMSPASQVFDLDDPRAKDLDYIPKVCRTCTAPGRSVGITDFVKAPAEAARAYRQEVLNRGN